MKISKEMSYIPFLETQNQSSLKTPILKNISNIFSSGKNFKGSPVKKDNQQRLQNQNIDLEELKKLIEEIRKKFDAFNKYLRIDIDDKLNIPVVKIIDKVTNQVIRQIPPEYMLKLMKNIDQMLGLLLNEKV